MLPGLESSSDSVLQKSTVPKIFLELKRRWLWHFVGPKILLDSCPNRMLAWHSRETLLHLSVQLAGSKRVLGNTRIVIIPFMTTYLLHYSPWYLYILLHLLRGSFSTPPRHLPQLGSFIITGQCNSSDFITGIRGIGLSLPMLRSQHPCQVQAATNPIE